jgi:sec-independent protein translocase protein TatB
MFDGVGFGEWLVIAVVALLVVGPKDLPKLLKSLGQFTRKMRMMADEFKNNFEDIARHSEITELRKEIDELRKVNPINQIRDEISGAINQGSDYYHSKPDEKPVQSIEHIDDDYISAHNQSILENEKIESETVTGTSIIDNIKLPEEPIKEVKEKEIVDDKSS